MKLKMLAAGFAVAAVAAVPAQAKELKFAFQGTLNSLDPYNLNETFHLGTQGNFYEGLIRREADLSIAPSLATKWEIVEPTRWRFHLRKGVKFHNGNEFNADDVVFSADRSRAEGSDVRTRISGDTKVVKVDDYTVDFITTKPNPIIHVEWGTWYIMDKEWAEANNAVSPQNVGGKEENYATRHANGTGPFILESHEAGVKTVANVNPNWWDNANKQGNVTKVTFTPIGSDATRVAALLSGQVDMAYPIPVQDQKRVDSNNGTRMLIGPELRTIFLGMDQHSDELLHSNVKGKNPFKDKRVREAFFRAIDINAIQKKVMRGLSDPSALMIAPSLTSIAKDRFTRLSFDPAKSKALLAEAGYADGFEVGMDCPNDRYVNDEAICSAVTAMLAKVGVKVNLLAQPKAKYFPKVLAPNLDVSFYLLGWTPGSLDSWNVLYNMLGCPRVSDDAPIWNKDDRNKISRGKFNLGGYCNPKVDALTDQILSETDQAKRDKMIEDAFAMTIDDIAYIPLHQQALAWGVRDGVDVAQRADNQFKWRHVVIK
jgi:peptide/nickel transport system substrate-binding protein